MKVIFRSVLLLCLLQFAYCVEIIAEDEIVKYNVSKDLVLQCNVKNGDGTKQQFKWKKDDKEVHTIDSLQNRITLTENENNATLTISKATENDAGNYTCTGTAGQANIIATTPITVNTPENVNVVEGDKLRIVCVVGGRPSPQVFWTVGGVNYTSSAGHIILQEDEKNVSNAVLLIDNVNMTYKGPYKCIGYSSLTNEFVEDEAMVRVKDKYAALWPFLGICLEVFVLCAVILIYEKKRNKSELEESDTDQSPDQKNTPDHGKESNLRHRQ